MIEQKELSALSWLHGKLKLDEHINLYYLIGNLRLGKHELYYRRWQESGREIWSPNEEIGLIQKQVGKILLLAFPRHPSCFGFSGGSCRKAAEKHVGFGSMLMLDLRHAFSQISYQRVFEALYANGKGLNPHLSFYSARFVADLCTVGEICWRDEVIGHPRDSWGGYLPQGASTSPRLFDLCLASLDEILQTWAGRLGLTYTRYADNLFFSSREGEFPKQARCILLSEVGKCFRLHKVRQARNGNECRVLGLNVSDSVSNTRDFKRSFRGVLHHLEYALDNRLEYQKAWEVASGYAGFAIKAELSDSLWAKFESLKNKIHLLEWGW